MNSNHIYINPSFITRIQPKIHVNPSFVNSLKQNLDVSQPVDPTKNHHSGCRPNHELATLPKSKKELSSRPTTCTIGDYPKFHSKDSLTWTGGAKVLHENHLQSELPLRPCISVCVNKSLNATRPSLDSVHGSSKHTKQLVQIGKLSSQNNLLHLKNLEKSFYSSDYVKSLKSAFPPPRKTRSKFYLGKYTVKNAVHHSQTYYSNSAYKKQYQSYQQRLSPINKAKYAIDNREIKPSNQILAEFNAKLKNSSESRLKKKSNEPTCLDPNKNEKEQSHMWNNIVISHNVQPTGKELKRGEPQLESRKLVANLKFKYKKQNESKVNSPNIVLPNRENCQTSNLNTNTQPNTAIFQSRMKNNRNYLYTSKLKLVRNSHTEEFPKFSGMKDSIRKKSNYAVRTKTKLIRRSSMNSIYKTHNHSPNTPKFRKAALLRKGLLLKAKENLSKGQKYTSPKESLTLHEVTKLKSKYKLVNRPREMIEISKYKVNRIPNSKRTSNLLQSSSLSRVRRHHRKSDRFISIEGSLYKSTRTSLKKQGLTSKTNKSKEILSPKIRVKKFSSRNSKFVYRRQSSTNLQSGTLIEIVRRKKLVHFKRINDYCFFYNKYGRCKKEKKGCPFIHDPNRIAICTRFLQGSCTVKDCPFSHTMDKNKMPVCSHFLEGSCHRENCPYRHVRVNPKAPLCRNFLKGHCPQGEACKKKHVLVCEEFKASGTCPRGKSCPLSHRKETSTGCPQKKRKLSTSSKKKGKKIKKSGKIGVLGLYSVFDRNEENNSKGISKGTSSGRYFDCPEGEGRTAMRNDQTFSSLKPVTKETPNSKFDQSETINKPTSPETGNETTDSNAGSKFEEKRERVLRKIEKLKRNYNIGLNSVGHSENAVISNIKKESTYNWTNGENVESRLTESHTPSLHRSTKKMSFTMHQPETPIKLRFLPLPDVLPSYIPLALPEDE